MLALLATLPALACAPFAEAPVPDRYELANMREDHFVPKSSPAALITAFRRFCVGLMDTPDTRPGALRAADYVELPNRPSQSMRAWVVDDRHPAVMQAKTQGAIHCAVGAQSRTGQSARVQAMIARDFPKARALTPPAGAEQAWDIGGGRLIYTIRENPAVPPVHYILALAG